MTPRARPTPASAQPGRRFIAWPAGLAAELGCAPSTLDEMRLRGDHPQLYALTAKMLVTTDADVAAWLQSKAVPPGYRTRAATAGSRRAAA